MLLSVIAVGRDDNYNSNYIKRTKLFIDSLCCNLEGIEWELILVDYNQNSSPFYKYFDKYKNIKPVVVTSEEHKKWIEKHIEFGSRFVNKKRIRVDLFEELVFSINKAFNKGIEQSKGEYILTTCTDNIFPLDFKKKVLDHLQPNCCFKALRVPVLAKIDDKIFDILYNTDKLELCGYKKLFDDYNLGRALRSVKKGTGDFILMDRNSWKEIGKWLPFASFRSRKADILVMYAASVFGKYTEVLRYPIFHLDHNVPESPNNRSKKYWPVVFKKNKPVFDIRKILNSTDFINWDKKHFTPTNWWYNLKTNFRFFIPAESNYLKKSIKLFHDLY